MSLSKNFKILKEGIVKMLDLIEENIKEEELLKTQSLSEPTDISVVVENNPYYDSEDDYNSEEREMMEIIRSKIVFRDEFGNLPPKEKKKRVKKIKEVVENVVENVVQDVSENVKKTRNNKIIN